MATASEKRAQFRRLHESGCFVIPNFWDVGSARMLQGLGFQALASSSAGFAWTLGRMDNEVTLDGKLAHLAAVCAATDLPVNADFENGFADAPEDVAANVRRALEAGVAGLSIEDMIRGPERALYDTNMAVARIRAARGAIDAEGSGAVLVARAEGILVGKMDVSQTLDRLVALADAGADCLFAPGLRTPDDIAAAVRAVAPKPLSVLMMTPGGTVAQFADLGVRRISVGGSLARAAWGGFLAAAREIAAEGTFAGLGAGASGAEIAGLLKP
jgi:2-methylisocitrate lyase-like PEP mutase family enzyme